MPTPAALTSIDPIKITRGRASEGVAAQRPTSRRRSFAPQTMLYMDFDPAETVFELISGVVKCYRIAPDGQCLIERFVGPGALLGLGVRDEYGGAAEALTAVEAQVHSRCQLAARARRDPALARRLNDSVIDQLEDARDHMLMLSCLSTEQRVAWFLGYLAERFEADNGGYLPTPMSRRDIADFLGLALETVSRTLNAFRRSGLIDMPHPHRIRLVDPDAMDTLGSLAS